MTNLAELMTETKRRGMVGRDSERRAFLRWLVSEGVEDRILGVVGPGGIGKTTLLAEFAVAAQELGVPVVEVDGRQVDGSPAGIRDALGQLPGDALIMIDGFDQLTSLSGWFQSEFLPNLPSGVKIVFAARRELPVEWRTDLAMAPLITTIRLRNLSREDARRYLSNRGVPPADQPQVLDFTHGHPLALSLVADLYRQGVAPVAAVGRPDVLHELITRLLDSSPDQLRRQVFEVASLVRVTTEGILADVFGDEVAAEAFAWLTSLSCVEPYGVGAAPHDLAREAVVAELRWRNPARFRALHDSVRAQFRKHLAASDAASQTEILIDYLYLHRHSPFVRPFIDWNHADGLFLDTLRSDDLAPILKAVERHEGPDSAALVQRWAAARPQAFTIFRDGSASPRGYLLAVSVDAASDTDDPALRDLANKEPRIGGEADGAVIYFRSWMDLESYQDISPVQSRIFIEVVRQYFATKGLAFSLFACSDVDAWAPIFAYGDLERLAHLDFEVDGHAYGVYGHDWRRRPPAAWLDLLAEREAAQQPDLRPPPAPTEPILLSESDFKAAVVDALRNFARPGPLAASPLRSSRIVTQAAGGGDTVTALVHLLQEAAAELEESPRDAKLYRALYHGCLNPAESQEAAARLTHVSLSTFRRHLEAARERISEALWARESALT